MLQNHQKILIENVKAIQSLIYNLNNNNLNKKSQRKMISITNRGLKTDNELYTRLILYLRSYHLPMTSLKPNYKQLKDIVINVYKNFHPSSVKSLQKFIKSYELYILCDVNGEIINHTQWYENKYKNIYN